jgi:glycosyltransferase involved in cell wall biosynthesis
MKKIINLDIDLLVIHNWYNLLSIDDLKILTKKFPTIFVLHDQRISTGGCHVTLDCGNSAIDCRRCPASRIPGLPHISKVALDRGIAEFGKFGVIAPSDWILDKIRGSEIARNAIAVKRISNAIHSSYLDDSFKPPRKPGKVILTFISASLDSPFKGLRLLIESLSLLDITQPGLPEIELCVIGKGHSKRLNILPNGIHLNYQGRKSGNEIQNILATTSFLVVPSLSENSPGVISEAQLLGVPVVATNVGGIPELISENETGFLSTPDPEKFSKAIRRAIMSPDLDTIIDKARDTAQKRHSEFKIFNEFNEFAQVIVSA